MDKESLALSKLQAAAGLLDKPQVERLDWMYEQSTSQIKPDDDTLMNMPVPDQKDKDLEDVKRLKENTAGSLFLRSATKTTEDMLRKLREDPLFQIRRQEQVARESMMANPLVRARLQKKLEKCAKKQLKKDKRKAKKQKKAMKKAAKASKKAAKKRTSSSSDSESESRSTRSDGSGEGKHEADRQTRALAKRALTRSPSRRRALDQEALGPSAQTVSKRQEYAATLAVRKELALASRGAPRRMDEEEKRQRLEQMQLDAAKHEKYKDARIANAELREREKEELDAKMRMTSDQKYFRGIRQEAYMESGTTVADRLKNQRHRRQKHINDPLERDD